MINKRILIYITSLIAFLIWYPQPAGSMVPAHVELEPNVITIGTFFNGTQLTVSGRVGAENEVVVVIGGKPEDLKLKKKGKALGLLWMNMGSVHFNNVPNVYMLYSSKGIMELAKSNPGKWEQLGIGFESLTKKMEIKAPQAERDNLAQEFIKLKQSQDLYTSHPGEIHFETKNGTERFFKADIWIPSRMAVGDYQVRVLEIHKGVIVNTTLNQLTVKLQGTPAMLSSLAFNHSLFYGGLAVLVAVAAGLIMDFFFGTGKGGGAH